VTQRLPVCDAENSVLDTSNASKNSVLTLLNDDNEHLESSANDRFQIEKQL
jgi:hypothetical protein